MTTKTISELDAASAAVLTDLFETTQGSTGSGTGTAKKVSGTQLLTLFQANMDVSWGDMINVKNPPYNATGNGITDDTVALQAALTAACATGNAVLFPHGTYLTNTLSVCSNTLVMGVGKGATKIVSSVGSPIFVNFTNVTEGVEFRDMTLYSRYYATGGNATGVGIQFTGDDSAHRPSGVKFTNLDIRGFAVGISNYLCANFYYTDLFITHCAKGVVSDTCADINFNCVLVQNVIANADNNGYGFTFLNDGLHGQSGEGVRMTNCSTNGQWGGMLIQNQDFGECIGFSFTTGATNMVVLQGGTQWAFSSGEIAPAATFSSLVVAVGASQASSNCSFTGIKLLSGSYGASINGNSITLLGCNFYANGAGSSIDVNLGATSVNCGVSACVFKSSGFGGVSINETAGGDYNLVTGNRVVGSVVMTGTHSSATNNLVIV